MTAPAEQCPQCRYSLAEADKVYGDFLVELEPVLTFPGFPEKDHAQLVGVFNLWRQDFPQLFVSLYLGPVPEGPSLATFGFWLLNHSQATVDGQPWNNQATILLVADPDQRMASLTLGYTAEKWLPAAAVQNCLKTVAASFRHRHWVTGALSFLQKLREELVNAARTAGTTVATGGLAR